MKRAEDILGSVPFVGSLVRSGQRASIDSFNNAAINRALEPIGETLPKGVTAGREAIAAAESKLGAAYNKLMPKMVGQLDNDLQSDIVNIAQLGANLPDKLADELNRVIKTDVLGKFSPGGGISGKTLQEIGTDLRNMSQRMAASESPDVRRQGMALKELRASLDRMIERANPDLAAEKKAIDNAYSNFKIVQRAAQSTGTQEGVFTPAQLSQAVRMSDKSKDRSAFAKGTARMQDLSDSAKDVLPQRVPDSGTPERAALMALLTGGGVGYVNPLAGIGLGAASLPYTKPGMALTNSVVSRLSQTPGVTRGALSDLLGSAGPLAGPGVSEMLARPRHSLTVEATRFPQ